jgi:UDP-glucose:(heptosyl)LPS alpha-1,3-glucosyltransferase
VSYSQSKVVILKANMSSSKGGGLEKSTRYLAKAFFEKGMQVTVLTSGAKDSWTQEGINYVNVSGKTGVSVWDVKKFDQNCQKWLSKNACEIIFGMERNSFQTHYRAGSGVHKVYLQQRNRQDSWLKGLFNKINPLQRLILSLEKTAFEHPLLKVLFTNSSMVKEEILSNYQIDSKKIHVVHNGVQWTKWGKAFSNWEEGKLQTAKKYNLNPNLFQLLFVGNGYRRKGLKYLLHSLSRIEDKNFQLVVLGKDKEISYYKRLACKLSLENQVLFLGEVSSLTPFYQLADCLVIPSLYDPFANVTVEALAMGVYVLTSFFNGGKEVLTPFSGAIIPDLFCSRTFSDSLREAMAYKKTQESSCSIRNSVENLDYQLQMDEMIKLSMEQKA